MSGPFELKEFDDWQEFREFVEEEFAYDKSYVFRGHRDANWPLQTTLDRLINKLPKKLRKENVLQNHLQRFRNAIRGKRGTNPSPLKTDDEFWSLGQHYGLATPLLDWSLSPFIATYFAFTSSKAPTCEKRCLWALKTLAVKEASNAISAEYGAYSPEDKEKYFEKSRAPIVTFVDPSIEDNPRIINQAGLFTRGPVLTNLEDWFSKFLKDYKRVGLYKITLPDSERETVLAALDQMNINALSLFPDISGACLYCNETLSVSGEMFNTMIEVQDLLKLATEGK